MAETKYLHGFSKVEQDRLLHQAKFLERWTYEGIDLKKCKNLLEVGCGVGAQTKIILQRFPKIHVDGVDFSPEQLSVAKSLLKKDLGKRVELHHQDAQKLSLDKKFDSAFLCWFLEHVPEPHLALKQVRKHLKAGARIYCTEVFNHSLYFEPYGEAFFKYWTQLNDFQPTIQGHPNIGGQLGPLLKEAGFKNIQLEFRPLHFDSRETSMRNRFIEYFFNILLSAAPALLESKRVSQSLIDDMTAEVKVAQAAKNGLFYYSFVRAIATA